ncbi:MAG: cation-translocating P-type ATPase [Alphaproteobacteria bacterium]|nr:cation-translocating P-type ATPase [Alphaproteobacteria bacterium]
MAPLLDDPQVWQQYSQSCASTPQGAHTWESQVVLQGMHCATCAFTIEDALRAVPGVSAVMVNAATQRAKVTWSDDQVRPSVWMQAIERVGYRAMPAQDHGLRAERLLETRRMLWRFLVAAFCMMQVMMYASPAYFTEPGDISTNTLQLLRWASWVLTLPVVIFSCTPFWRSAWRDLRQRRISMDLPVALGMLITFVVSTAGTFDPQGPWGAEVYFDSLTMFVFFLLGGRWLEWRLRDQTAGALEALMNRLPESIERQSAGQWERVALHRLRPGDVVCVRAGDAVPGDGVVVHGQTLIEEALLTGESRPCARGPQDVVMAGSHNLSASIEVRLDRVGSETRYAQLVRLMEQATSSKPRLALLADRLARPFLWGVLALAALAALFWWSTDRGQALMVAVSVLIVTCPCALSLATPAAMLASAGQLARAGVLVRELQALETLGQIDTVVFDKTGTLTHDGQRLQVVHTAAGTLMPEQAGEWMVLAAGLAAHSWHPVSRALVAAAPEYTHASEVHEISGQGLEGCAIDARGQRRHLRLGSLAFGQHFHAGMFCPEHARDATVHLFDAQRGWLASFDLAEDLRSDAASAVRQLRGMGLDIWILSGDRTHAVQRVAQWVGVEAGKFLGSCSPQDKLDCMRALQAQGRRVLMVGDGLNDGPVLAAAQVSIALGGSVPLAQARSDLVMMGARLLDLPALVRRARQTTRVVWQNLAWALFYNALFVPLALIAWLPAWLAGLGMAVSSLWVIAHSMRLSRPMTGEWQDPET